MLRRFLYTIASLSALLCPLAEAAAQSMNQTETISPILPGDELPFKVSIEQAEFTLPSGIQSYVSGIYKGKWVLLAGRTNGLHGFDNFDNFPPLKQNTVVYVVDPKTGIVKSKSLYDPTANLTQAQIDTLSVTSSQAYQKGKYLYMTGGYGIDTASGLFSTKDTLTAIDLKGLIHWVSSPSQGETASKHIRQIRDPIFRITGGYMDRSVYDLTLLVFGQDFQGAYTPNSNGIYSKQVRRFKIRDNGSELSVKIKDSAPLLPNDFFRRRDLNIVPVMQKFYGLPLPGYVAFSGVFTEQGGAWTVPVFINYRGNPSMEDPARPSTFKQGMNNYVCPTVGMFSEDDGYMYVVMLGGISFGYFQNGVFATDPELPFINQVTTVRLNKQGLYEQFIMDAEYPVIASTGSNPGNTLLFGAAASFFPKGNLSVYRNGVIKFDRLPQRRKLVGYIVGGIMSTLPNTMTRSDSTASPYVFKVYIEPKIDPEEN